MTPEGPPAPLEAYATWPAAYAAPPRPHATDSIRRRCNICCHTQGTEMTLKQQSCNHRNGYREVEMAPEVHQNGGWVAMPPGGHPGTAADV